MKKKISLVCADIDMTLTHRLDPLPEINKQAMERLHEAGIYFGLASGRSVAQLKDKAEEWGLSFMPELLIGVNGSVMYDGLKKKEENLLLFEKDWINEIMDFLDANHYDCHVYIDDYTLFSSANSHFYELVKKVSRDMRLSKRREDYLKGNFFKFLLLQRGKEMEELIRKFQPILERHRNDFKLLKTTAESYEIVHAATDKSYPLIRFCEDHRIPLDQVMSFGDADNDNGMLEVSGIGVCLKNGEKSTKEAADVITELDCGEGGFGDYIFRHVLKDLR
ncbi:MAG: HAD family hydrolase [Erysipelotrichaceae bacterium]|nr:HAD family hydrolase [Erysipelotrichaceae bacterium]